MLGERKPNSTPPTSSQLQLRPPQIDTPRRPQFVTGHLQDSGQLSLGEPPGF